MTFVDEYKGSAAVFAAGGAGYMCLRASQFLICWFGVKHFAIPYADGRAAQCSAETVVAGIESRSRYYGKMVRTGTYMRCVTADAFKSGHGALLR